MEKNKKSILIFIAISFGLTWISILIAFAAGIKSGDSAWATLLIICMFFPAIASIVTRKIMGEGFKNFRIKPNLKGNVTKYLIALVLPAICIISGCAMYFMLYPTHLDPLCTNTVIGMVNNARSAGIEMTEDAARGAFYVNTLVAFLVAPFANLLVVFGEELGWRGYLLQKLCNSVGIVKAILLNGVIWGIWHLPMIAMGHNYGTSYWGYPIIGILLMILFCVSVGAIVSYFTIKTGSIIPACFIHSAVNGLAGVGFLYINSQSGVSMNQILLVGPTATGILGMSIFLLVGALYLVKSRRIKWNKEKESIIGK